MSRRLILAVVVIGLMVPPLRAQTPSFFSRGTIPTRTALARVGLERHWSAAIPLGAGTERVLVISQAGDMIFAQTNMANFHAFEAETGRYLWNLSLGRRTADARPAAVNSNRVFVTNATALFCLDRGTGRVIWTKEIEDLPASATAADEETVMVGLRSGKLVAYTVRDHSQDRPPGVSPATFAWAWKTDAPLTGRAIPTERVVAFASQDKRVYVAVLDKPPTLLYRFLANGPISATMGTFGTRTLLVPCEDNNVYALDLFTADSRWVFSTGAPVQQEPLVAGNQVYVLNKLGRLIALDVQTGKPRWDVLTSRGQLQALSPTRVYLRSYDRDLMIVDRGSGQVLADARMTIERSGLNLREYTLAPTNSINDRLYFATPAGALLCLREMGRTTPSLLRDPNAPKFGYVPVEGEPNPPGTAPAAGATTGEPAPPDADAAKPKAEPKPGDAEKPAYGEAPK